MVLFRSDCSSCWIAFMVCFSVFVCKVRTDCCSKKITSNFGETSKMTCGVSDTSRSVTWFKNGKIIRKTPKTAHFSGNLYIYCVESSDSGVYMCKDKVNLTEISSYSLTVKNQENKTYFHIYNQYHQECVSRRGKQLFIEACDVNQCSQKWSWSPSQQIISALDYANPYCISVNQLVNKKNVVLDSCQSVKSFQKWECKDYDLLSIQGQNLYFNYGNTGTDIVLFTGSGSWSRWVKYSTGRRLCDGDCCSKEITPNFGETSKMACGVSNSSRRVVWLKNGREVSNTTKTEITSGYLNIFCLETSDSGEYVCKDKNTSATIDSHYLDVKNPEHRMFFHIYNAYHGKCVSRVGKQLFVASCDLKQCSQKWSWSPSRQIKSALDDKNPECISVDHFFNKKKIVMDFCNSSASFQKWECKDGDLLSIHGEELYFNYGNTGNDIVLFTGSGSWSHWIKYLKRETLCDKGRPNAKITCPQEVTLKENDNFSCWCKAIRVNSSPTVTWIKNTRVLGEPSSTGQELKLRNVSNEASGIYVCRAQFYQLIHEEMIAITVQYVPRIISFYGILSGNNSLTVTCRGEGLPKPTYKILADDTEVKEAINGMAIIHDNMENNETTYKCIAMNNLGHSTKYFSRSSLSPLKVLTCQKNFQESATSIKNEKNLPFIFIAAIAGVFLGIILVFGVQWLRGRRKRAFITEQQSTENPCYENFSNAEQDSNEQLTLSN